VPVGFCCCINTGSNVCNSLMLYRFKYILNSISVLEENDNVNGQIRPINNPGLMLLQNRPREELPFVMYFFDVFCRFRSNGHWLTLIFLLLICIYTLASCDIELGPFVLNFGGRVKMASVKNFQLCERDVQDHIMQFGWIGLAFSHCGFSIFTDDDAGVCESHLVIAIKD